MIEWMVNNELKWIWKKTSWIEELPEHFPRDWKKTNKKTLGQDSPWPDLNSNEAPPVYMDLHLTQNDLNSEWCFAIS
jgi:hypothetical protein